MSDLELYGAAADLAYQNAALGETIRFGQNDQDNRLIVATSQGNLNGFSGFAAYSNTNGMLTISISGSDEIVDFVRDVMTVLLFGGTGSRQTDLDLLVSQAMQNIHSSTGSGICGLTFVGHSLGGLDAVKAALSGKYPGSIAYAFNSPSIGGVVGSILDLIGAPGGSGGNIKHVDAESPGLYGVINILGFRGNANIVSISGAVGHGIGALNSTIYRIFHPNTAELSEKISGINSQNASVVKQVGDFLSINGGGDFSGFTLKQLLEGRAQYKTDATTSTIIPGQMIQGPAGTSVPAMETISTPSGPQQVWVGSHGVTQQDSWADRQADKAAADRAVAEYNRDRQGVESQHGATGTWLSSGGTTYPINGGGTTPTYNSGTGYVGDHPGPNKPPSKPDLPKHGGGRPIVLDLNGNGVQITDLNKSTQFIDSGNDGLKHRTAWAASGDGVLFFDADNDNTISQTREYVFTEWDPTAKSDMQALRARFDSNNDGKLTAADAAFAQFKVMVTQADGSQVAQSLTQLGITEIRLTEDATKITLTDGSMINRQSTFVMNGVTRTVASAVLMAETQGYRVVEDCSGW